MPTRLPPFKAATDFGARVRDRRNALGISQEAVADRAGLHFSYVSTVERGLRNVSLLNMLKIAQALDVDLADLVHDLRAD